MQKTSSNANGFEPFEYVFEQHIRAEKLDSYYKFCEQLHLLASQQPGYTYHERRLLGGTVRFAIFRPYFTLKAFAPGGRTK